MATLFGKELRKIRIDCDERLLDMAKRLTKTAAFISAIETGRKSPPVGFEDSVAETYNLSKEVRQKLVRTADQVRKNFTLTPKTDEGRATIGLLARKINNLSDYDLEGIKNILEKDEK